MFDIEDETPEEKKTRFKAELEQYISKYIHNGYQNLHHLTLKSATEALLLERSS